MDIDLIEELAEQVHDEWMEAKRAQGITSRPAEDGTEQMVPYDELPDAIQELDRVAVRTVLNALKARGYHVVLDTNTL